MKKINKVVGEAKVSVREKIGKKDSNITEPPDYKNKSNNIDGIRTYSKDLLNRLSKQSKSNQGLIEENESLGQKYIQYGKWYSEDGSSIPVGSALSILGDLHVQMEVCRSRMDIAINNSFTTPLQNFVKTDLKDAHLAKSRYDKFRISFDAASESFKNLRKKPNANSERLIEAEDHLNYATQQFSDVALESINQIEDILDKHNVETIERIYDCIKTYQDYFQKGLEIVNNVIPEIEQHRQTILKNSQTLSEKKKKRTDNIVFDNPSNNINLSQQIISNYQHAQQQQQQQQTKPSSNSFKNSKLFGIPLETVFENEGGEIPTIVMKSICYLEEKGINVEGIFRVSPNQKYLLETKAGINSGSITNFDHCDDPHIVSGFLKSFLRELPVPLLTYELYPDLTRCVLESDGEPKKNTCEKISLLLKTLPKCNFLLTKSLIHLLYKISLMFSVNKMTTSNLAVVMAPNILYPDSKNLNIESIANSNATIEFLISNYLDIFGGTSSSTATTTNPISKITHHNNPHRRSITPPVLPTKPTLTNGGNQSVSPILIKSLSSNPVVSLNNNNSYSPPPLPSRNNRLSISTSALKPTTSSPNLTPQTSTSATPSPPSSPQTTPANSKINHRVSMYLQNFQAPPPSLPPKPSPGPLRKSIDIPLPLPPNHPNYQQQQQQHPATTTPTSSLSNSLNSSTSSTSSVSSNNSLGSFFKKNNNRPSAIKLPTTTTTIYQENTKGTYSLLDDSFTIEYISDKIVEEDELLNW
eukprot:gene6618-8189_t